MKNLLIITPRYPHESDQVSGVFVKSQVDAVRRHFEKVMVISTTPYTPKLLTRWTDPRRKRDALVMDYEYDNVEVHFTKNIVIPLEFLKRFRSHQGYRSVRRILGEMEFVPDLIHAHFVWPSGCIAMMLKHEIDLPYVVTGHGYDLYDLPLRGNFYRNAVSLSLVNADHVICVSSYLRNIVLELASTPEDKTSVIPNGFDPSLFHPMDRMECRKVLDLPSDMKIVFSAGNLVPVKGHNVLLTAAPAVFRDENVLFLLAGEGPESETLRQKAKDLGIENRFRLIGAKPHDEMPLWMNASDLYVQPSLNESFGVAIIEALACGRPIVGTDTGGIPEVICDEDVGIIVPPGDAEALATAIVEALRGEWSVDRILAHASGFTIDRIAERILRIYKAVVTDENP